MRVEYLHRVGKASPYNKDVAENRARGENPLMLTSKGFRLDSVEAVADRLRLTREAAGYAGRRQAEFARFLGIPENTYNHYELARRLIPVQEALKLRRRVGASLDWIYHGEGSNNAASLAEALARIEPQRAAR
jgi:DNA-binding XRE family transcriptional regulator